MQFIPDGPHIPDELIRDLEDDKVVLFCGAGVSKNVDLPDFRDLVKLIYSHLFLPTRDYGTSDKEKGCPDNEEEFEEFKAKNFDRVLGLLESRLGDRARVRSAVKVILEIPPATPLPFHSSLLDLARTSSGAYRLVTTNFDRGFVTALGGTLPCDSAPALRPPLADRWTRLVHLHGLIGADGGSLEDLVMTSADFGDAYINSGWASRFVTELFSRFSVLFIGYSVSDPVMRYLIDALAVERARRPVDHRVYSLVPSDKADTEIHRAKWKARGIDAIAYGWDKAHSVLVDTIRAWADIHKSGQVGRLQVVSKYAGMRPTKPYEQDYRVSQMMWALRDQTGQAARKFGEFEPPPPVEWLEPLEKSGLLSLCGSMSSTGDWRVVKFQGFHPTSSSLHAWLLKHLDKREVIERVIASNGLLHPSFQSMLRWWLRRDSTELPEPYRGFWLLVSSSVASPLLANSEDVYDVSERLKAGGSDALLRHLVLHQLRPCLGLSRPVMHLFRDHPNSPPADLTHLADVEIVLTCGSGAPELIRAIRSRVDQDPVFLVGTVYELTSHLRLAMDLYAAAGLASNAYDPSIYQRQSLM